MSSGDDAIEHRDGVVGVDPSFHLDRQCFAGVLVDDVQEFQDATVRGRVELEVERPHLIRTLRAQPRAGDGGDAEALPLAPLGRHPQALLAPQALDPLAVHLEALAAQGSPGAPVTPAGMLARELAQAGAQRLVTITPAGLVALRGAVLAGDPARPPLRHREPLPQHAHGLASARRAHQFPFAISFKASISSSCSATIRFSFPFSRSNSFSRLTSSAFNPPYC